MGLREDAVRAHPDFPWLAAEDSDRVGEFLESRGWLAQGEILRGCERAGDGNMNLTLRIRTSTRSFILKQSRPWVEKYPDIAAPWDRTQSELRFYRSTAGVPGVANRMPRLIGGDPAARVLLLEDLPDARDLSSLYASGTLESAETGALAGYLAALHSATRTDVAQDFSNEEMRALNHAHLFVIPLDADNGLDLDAFEDGLAKTAARVRLHPGTRQRVAETGERYLRDGPCLVHGDYFPGSWLRCADGLRIIDPEFSFRGDAEVDLGCALAHLALANQGLETAENFLDSYRGAGGDWDPLWLARYAAVEVMRRLIGVAQLPLPACKPGTDTGPRSRLLERSCQSMTSGRVGDLF